MTTPAPYVGQPATINLYSDSQPAVVVKVNKKSILVRRVEVDESTRSVRNPGEPFPCVQFEGDVTKPVGEPERFGLVETSAGPRYRNGSISVTLGRSVQVRDYRY